MFGRNGYGRHVTDEMNGLDEMAGAIVGLGALNWGLVGLANFDAVRAMFGKGAAARVAYENEQLMRFQEHGAGIPRTR